MRKIVKRIAIGTVSVVVLTLVAGFIYLPEIFSAKYAGPTIRTEDGKALRTFVQLPEGEGPFPTIIVRSPYELPHTPLSGMDPIDFSDVDDKDLGKTEGWPEITKSGYALVIQHSRGRIGSEGKVLNLTDRKDARELVDWVRKQPWSNGRIGTTGDSIEAILAMLTNAENLEGVDASYVQIGTPDLINEALIGPGGALKLETFFPWVAEQILTADEAHYREMGYGPIESRLARIRMGLTVVQLLSDSENAHTVDAWKHLPWRDYPVFSDALAEWNQLLDARPGSAFASHYNATGSKVPTFYVAAWHDVFAPSQLTAFERGEIEGLQQRMLVLNGTHFSPEDPAAWPIKPILPWFDYLLKGEQSALLELPRVIFPISNGDDEWYGTDTWPPASATTDTWYLTAAGALDKSEVTSAGSGTRIYRYDPENPVPTIGGKNLLISHGPLDQQAIREDKRSDVLSYDSAPLSDEVVIAGHVYADLSISSDAPDTDFTVKILDIHPDGTSTLVTEGIQRARFREGLNKEIFMSPGEVYSLKIDLGHMAWRFNPSHRIGVDISSSNFPQWDRNLNTDQPLFSSTEFRVANNTIHHGGVNASRIELPVITDLDGLELQADFKTYQSNSSQ